MRIGARSAVVSGVRTRAAMPASGLLSACAAPIGQRRWMVPQGTDRDGFIPGDDFGLYETRTVFTRPVDRSIAVDILDEDDADRLFDAAAPPEKSVSPSLVRGLAARLRARQADVVRAVIDSRHNINDALAMLESRGQIGKAEAALLDAGIEEDPEAVEAVAKGRLPPRSFGLVALELYEPETFCLVSYAIPRYEMLNDPAVLELLHELTLSAAEMPTDSSPAELVRRFATEWTVESGDKCGELLSDVSHGGIEVRAIAMLPVGEYSVNGMFVMHPAARDFPNIGTAAAAASVDLSTGVNHRFKFTVERIPDSVSEHVCKEHHSFGQQVSLLKQPYLWNPEYSVEDMLRHRESLLQPAAILHELRYAFCGHHMDDPATFARDTPVGPSRRGRRVASSRPNPYRNLLELEQLKLAQHELGKHFKENASPANVFTRNGNPVIIASQGEEGSGYARNDGSAEEFDDVTQMERLMLNSSGANTATEKLWRRFYADNLF